jgi:heme A synthase
LARGFVMPVHLVNTFLLLASLALTAYWASGGADFSWRGQGALGALLGVGVVAMIVLGVSGAVTALGDTLFPVASLGEGLAQDLSPAAHLFIRLRILHPVIAAAVGSYLVAVGIVAGLSRPARSVRVLGAVLVFVFSLQVAAGVVNLVLLAPVPLQLVHLLLADLTWIALVLLTATTFAQAPRRAAIASDPACATSSAVRV